jgi:hypothetical protein
MAHKRLFMKSTDYTAVSKVVVILLLTFPLINEMVYAQDETDVISSWLEYSDAPNSLYHHLSDQAYDYLKQRASKISELQTLADWQQRQKQIRETLTDIVGPFPDKTPLNARIVRTIDKKSYRIEHIIYESQPRFYVTSSLFIPAGIRKNRKTPAVIYCSGHSAEGYRSAVYQHVILNFVKKGFIVFAFDPVGQGERLEYYDPETGKSIVGGPTREHSYPGAQAFITGNSQALYMIWDGVRAVDYLMTRKEVDPDRIGITGRSGGGTQSAYIAAIDDRICAAAPENYLTNYTRLLQTIGPQDAEQNMFNLIFHGLDHPDFLIVRAPKPALMITTTRDMFSIQGAIETEKEVARIYKAYDKEENFSRVEDDAAHASTKNNREAMYAFFQKHLNNPGNPYDEDTQLLTTDELRVTATGQVSTSLGGETVFSLNLKTAENLDNKLNTLRYNPEVYLPGVILSAKKLSGYQEPSEDEKPVFTARIQRKSYAIEKYFVKGEGNYVIPYLLFKPAKSGNKSMIYLHPSGKSIEASAGGEIERFVSQGITVLAPDLIGTGETGTGALKGDAYFDGASHNLWYLSMLIGRSITGIQAGDVSRLTGILKRINNETVICGLARKEMAPALLHAAAFIEDIGNIILIEPFLSYRSIVMNRFYNTKFPLSAVPGALKEYDLPDLAGTLAPRRLFIAGATDGNGSTTDIIGINKDLVVIKEAYRYKNAEGNLKILSERSGEIVYKSLFDWLK